MYVCMCVYCKQDLFKDTSWMCVIVSVHWTRACSSKYLTRDFCVLEVWHWKLSDALAEIEQRAVVGFTTAVAAISVFNFYVWKGRVQQLFELENVQIEK